jgi:hypothetical protein
MNINVIWISIQVGEFLDKLGISRNRDNPVVTATCYELDSGGWIPGRGRRLFVLNGVQTGSGAHPAYYPMGTAGDFPGGKAAGA